MDATTQTSEDELEEPFTSLTIDRKNHLLTDLNDLEHEIANIRYKALSIQESLKWLEQEKVKLKRNFLNLFF
jgi:hypothetical protein